MNQQLINIYKQTPWDEVEIYNSDLKNKYLKALSKGVDERIARKSYLNYQFIIKYRNVSINPLFYFGNIHLIRPVVSISANGGFSDSTPEEHENRSISDWLTTCERGFLNYQSDQEIHKVFKNIGKILFGEKWFNSSNKRMLLAQNLINCDWAFLYSRSFPSEFNRISTRLNLDRLVDRWNQCLRIMLSYLAPRLIFVHSTSLKNWVNHNTTINTNNIKSAVAKLTNDRKREFLVWKGHYDLNGISIPVIFSEHFVNVTTKKEVVQELHTLI